MRKWELLHRSGQTFNLASTVVADHGAGSTKHLELRHRKR